MYKYTNFSLENLKGRDYLRDLPIDGRIILEWISEGKVWIGFIWLRIGSSGRLL